jgi:hypothetical protein
MRAIISVLLISLSLVGCNNNRLPKKPKNLHPVTITVMNGEQPVEGVAVTLSGRSSQGAFACTGLTDNQGVAKIRSLRNSYTVRGVPAGTYRVALDELPELPMELTPHETDEKLPPKEAATKEFQRKIYFEENQLIPTILTSPGSTPIELTVSENKETAFLIDVNKYH